MKVALTASPDVSRLAPIAVRGEVADAFAVAGELGYDGVELHLRDPAGISHSDLKNLTVRYGIGIPTLGTGLATAEGLTFAATDPSIRRRAVERVGQHIRLAVEIGSAVTIGLLSGRLGEGQRAARRLAALACLTDVCQAALAAGVTILLEPLNRYECDYINTLEDGLGVIEEIAAPNLKLLADTFHMNIEEVDIAASLRRAAPRLGHVHLVDSNRRAPGHGHLDIGGILRELRDIGYGGYLSFEMLPLPNPRQALEDGIRLVRSLLSQSQA